MLKEENIINKSKKIAFFCLEYAIEDNLPIYAGGLGVLAGDYLLEASSQKIPFYGLGLFYHQYLNDPSCCGFKPLICSDGKEVLIEIDIKNPPILAKVWAKRYNSACLFLFDTNIPQNSPEDREITNTLYDANLKNFLAQQLVLGIGGIKLLDYLDIEPAVYHLNEGHTSFAILGLLAKQKNLLPPKKLIVSTKHTIFSGAGVYINKENFYNLLNYFCNRYHLDIEKLFVSGSAETHPNHFSTTKFLLTYSRRSNGVSKSHCFYESQLHPGSSLIPITNGINPKRWQIPEFGEKYELSDEQIWSIHQKNKREMIKTIGSDLNEEYLTIVWARRITSYKQPLLIFSDLDRLSKLVNNPNTPIQIIIAGRIKENDPDGIELENQINKFCSNPNLSKRVVFYPNYCIGVAKKLVAGADVWLSTPEIGKEACSTSGMKSGINGVLQFSTNDGWVTEVNWENIGWIIPENDVSNNLYKILETQIAPLYYQRNKKNIPTEWIKRMRKTRKIILEKYTTQRMLNNYFKKLYTLKYK